MTETPASLSNGESDNKGKNFDSIETFIRAVRADLKDGGPLVSLELMAGYVDDEQNPSDAQRYLDTETRILVERLIHTWRNWYDEYLEMSQTRRLENGEATRKKNQWPAARSRGSFKNQ